MNLILFDGPNRPHLLPLTYTRPVAELRCGILTFTEKWTKWLSVSSASFATEAYLSQKFPLNVESENLFVLGGLAPDASLCAAIADLKKGDALTKEGQLLAFKADKAQSEGFLSNGDFSAFTNQEFSSSVDVVSRPWHIFSLNAKALESDFQLLTQGRTSQPLSSTVTVIGDKNKVFLEEGAVAECSVLNTKSGSIYLAKDSEIMEGCLVRGGLALGEHSQLKMGAKIYGATTLGPHCKVGGEVNNSVFTGFSNKGHDGFIGNSVIGEWCNLGADTNNSNLKNNYAAVKLWDYPSGRFAQTGLQFCGLVMGDHAKAGINTMFNTGTVVGVSANVFGDGFPRNFIPDFAWGGAAGFTTYKLETAYEVATRVFERRGMVFDDVEKSILASVFEQTQSFRNF